MQIISDTYEGKPYWRIDVNPGIPSYELFDFPGGARAAIGLDPATQNYKIVYLLYPQNIWSREELENNEQIRRLMDKCNVCSVLNQIKDSSKGSTSSLKPSLPSVQPAQVTHPQTAPPHPWSPDHTAPAQAQSLTQTAPVYPQTVRPSAGDVVQPRYLPVITNLGKSVFCTPLGSVAVSTLMSLAADLMAGWAKDPGHREAFQQMSDELIAGANVCPADAEKIRNDLKRLYEAYKKDGVVPALKKGMLKDVAEALRDKGIDVEADVQVKTKTHVGFGPRSLVD